MKKQVSILVAALALFFVAAVCTNAQSSRSMGRANIPFDFSINNHTLPAGEYMVERIYDGNGLRIRSVSGTDSITLLTNSVQVSPRQGAGKMVFHRYGDQYFLYRVWSSGERLGNEARASRAERGLRRGTERLARATQPGTILIAMR